MLLHSVPREMTTVQATSPDASVTASHYDTPPTFLLSDTQACSVPSNSSACSMSGDSITSGSSSVVFLVDSSVAVASQWQTVLKDYMSALLQRLAQHITTQSQPVPNAQVHLKLLSSSPRPPC